MKTDTPPASPKEARRAEARDRNGKVGLDRTTQDHIGERLRDLYEGLAAEPVPDRLLALLRVLDKSGSGQGS
jgi:hypothetical protein